MLINIINYVGNEYFWRAYCHFEKNVSEFTVHAQNRENSTSRFVEIFKKTIISIRILLLMRTGSYI